MDCQKSAVAVWLALCSWVLTGPATAGEFSVNPIRLEMGASARSGAISVRNEGKQTLSFQLQAMEWSQDATGTDQYVDTRDLIFFPKIMTVLPGQEGLVRVGTRTPLVPVEKTYRLFIEELPSSTPAPAAQGVQVSFLIRFGAPIFIAPVEPSDSLAISDLALDQGGLSLSAKNTGNRHQVVQGILLRGADAAGRELFSVSLTDRYLLAGTAKSYKAQIPRDQCASLANVEVEVTTDRAQTRRKLDVTPGMCAPR